MRNGTRLQSTGPGPARVLLIGDVQKALLEYRDMDRGVFEICDNVLDGIDKAARNQFETVAVSVEGILNRLGPILKALRKSTSARIVLLAQMHEEPMARRFVAQTPGNPRLADEYYVCPVRWAVLCSRQACEKGIRTNAERNVQDLETPRRISADSDLPVEVRHRMERLERLATTDDLTGLKNRRYLWEFARQILERARPTRGRVTLLVFDIDNFKHYNDLYGHSTGDEILRQAAILMRRCCRHHDVVGRIGGDEFAVVFWDDPRRTSGGVPRDRRSASAEHPTEAISVAKRFQEALSRTDLNLLGPKAEGVLTISGGLASFPRDGSTVQELFDRADRALRDAKRGGKNRIYLVGEPQSDIADLR
ncbi:MAG: GGDEF domain-containing protein [Phycisphaerae bacterium]|nr:GGDEF domain-containing protein [Phycisphaerae bacterium]HON93217.1 GGDEF domain-containing protein [Sedimentisphaerales bacterium]